LRSTIDNKRFWRLNGGLRAAAQGEPIVRGKIGGLAAALAFAVAAAPPAEAQFMTGPYPVIVVPPPPAQNYVIPRPSPAQTPRPDAPPRDASGPPEIKCYYQGQTKVCE
jgi:hypothetical protein